MDSVLLVVRECFIYKIPPRTTSQGYRASEWDVNAFLFTGRLRLISTLGGDAGDTCFIHIEDAVTGELFAKAPIERDGSGCESVIDSSRYFVIRLLDPVTGKHAFVGLGFQERSFGFDLQVAIQDYIKRLNPTTSSNHTTANQSIPDYSLKEGQNFTISIGGIKTSNIQPASSNSNQVDFSKFMIPPPPSSSRIMSQQTTGDAPISDFGSFQFIPAAGQNASNANGSSQHAGWITF